MSFILAAFRCPFENLLNIIRKKCAYQFFFMIKHENWKIQENRAHFA